MHLGKCELDRATAQSVMGLEINAIPACNAVKPHPKKEPAKAQKDKEGRG